MNSRQPAFSSNSAVHGVSAERQLQPAASVHLSGGFGFTSHPVRADTHSESLLQPSRVFIKHSSTRNRVHAPKPRH